MPFAKRDLAKMGGVQAHKGEFRAHFYLRRDTGEQINIIGPSRETEEEAQEDLEQIRAAGGVGKTRPACQQLAESNQPASQPPTNLLASQQPASQPVSQPATSHAVGKGRRGGVKSNYDSGSIFVLVSRSATSQDCLSVTTTNKH